MTRNIRIQPKLSLKKKEKENSSNYKIQNWGWNEINEKMWVSNELLDDTFLTGHVTLYEWKVIDFYIYDMNVYNE